MVGDDLLDLLREGRGGRQVGGLRVPAPAVLGAAPAAGGEAEGKKEEGDDDDEAEGDHDHDPQAKAED